MAISIHHGANGSYKTAGVVQDFAVPALKQGRTIVTNIRGLTQENVEENFDDLHPDTVIINYDTDTDSPNALDNRIKMRTFWHWAPLGALILIDEAGVIFPKRLKPSDIEKLNLDEETAKKEGRPVTFEEAFEMHRHYNWDIVLSAPSINKLRPDIRETTEGAYKHRNNKLIGFSGSYMEGFHSAEKSGGSASDFITINRKKIKQSTFKLYQSTKTGAVQDSSTGTSIFKNTRVRILLGFLILCFGYATYSYTQLEGGVLKPNGGGGVPDKATETNPQVSSDKVPSPVPRVSNGALSNSEYQLDLEQGIYRQYTFSLASLIHNEERLLAYMRLSNGEKYIYLTNEQLEQAGYSVQYHTDCSVIVIYKAKRTFATCNPSKERREPLLAGGVPEASL